MITLRPYQKICVDSVFEQWKTHRSALVVSPTGTGKTTIFAEIISRVAPKRCMIIVHRYELMDQAKRRLKTQCGIACDIEMAGYMARTGLLGPECVIATIQTLCSGDEGKERMTKFNPNDYSYIIVDEAHHATSKSYRKVLNYFKSNPDVKILGVTATPDRTDEEALKQIFDVVAFDYEILDAIHDGWLVPVDQQMVYVESIDFDKVKTSNGDLDSRELARIMEAEETLQGVADSAFKIIGNKRALAFASSVKHAEMLCDIFNRHKNGIADWVCGKTEKRLRQEKLERFKDGAIQIMVNCGVLTEGFDCPEVEVIIQARPTKSRCLYAQIIGRSLRPLPGIVESLETSDERKAAIAESSKKSALIIDYVGNATRHKLMTSADILGGKISPNALDRATKKAKEAGGIGQPVRMDELLDKSEEEIREEERKAIEEMERRKANEIARKAEIIANAKFSLTAIDAFNKYEIQPKRSNPWDDRNPLKEGQITTLQKAGVDMNGMSETHKKQLFYAIISKPSDKQSHVLRRAGYDPTQFSRSQASVVITLLANNGWSKLRVEALRSAKPNPIEVAQPISPPKPPPVPFQLSLVVQPKSEAWLRQEENAKLFADQVQDGIPF